MYKSASRRIQSLADASVPSRPDKESHLKKFKVVVEFGGHRAIAAGPITRDDAMYLSRQAGNLCRGRRVRITVTDRRTKETCDWHALSAEIMAAPKDAIGNIDPKNKAEQDRQRKLFRQQQSLRDRLRHKVGCPTCSAKVGEYCSGTNGPRLSHHAARWKAAAVKRLPSTKTVASGDIAAFVEQHGVTMCASAEAKGYGGIEPTDKRGRPSQQSMADTQKQIRDLRNRSR